MMDMGNDFFMVKFDMEEDRWKVMTEGPWMIFDHYLIVQTWTREFISSKATTDKNNGLDMLPRLGSILLR